MWGETDKSTVVFKTDLYHGTTGSIFKTVESRLVGAQKWLQLNTILTQAVGTTLGYAHIRRVRGSNPFIAYAIIFLKMALGARASALATAVESEPQLVVGE